MKTATKRVLLTAGAIFSFVTVFALFGLIFYQLFKPNGRTSATSSSHLLLEDDEKADSSAPHPLSLNTPSAHGHSATSSLRTTVQPLTRLRVTKKLADAKDDRERAALLVQMVNFDPNATWSARVNKHAIGLKPFSEMINLTNNFDPMNATFMMHPGRLRAIEMEIQRVFEPLYDRHLSELLTRIADPLPERFNSAQRWTKCAQSILRVRDQGGCGSCWAVAAVSVMSDRVCIASGGTMPASLSAQQLVECCDYCGGCTGAPNSFFPFLYWYQEGLVSDQCFPYTIARDCGYPCPPTEFERPRGLGNCTRRDQCVADRRKRPRRYRAKYVYKIGSLDEEEAPDEQYFPASLFRRLKDRPQLSADDRSMRAIDLLKRELMLHGPVMLCFSVFESFMHYYEGVYNFDLVPDEVHVYDHCVKVIGWGRQRLPNAQKGVQEYLLAVNSWSALWGKDGTFKMDVQRLSSYHSDLFAGVPLSG